MVRSIFVATLSAMFVVQPAVAQAHPFGRVTPSLRFMAPTADEKVRPPPPPPQPGSPAAEAAAQAQPQPQPPPPGYPSQSYPGQPPPGYPPPGYPPPPQGQAGQAPPQGHPYPYYYYPYPYPYPPPPKRDDDDDDDDDDDRDSVPGKGMMIGGFVTFGVSYLTFALTSGLFFETAYGAIPIAGPYLFIGESEELAPLWIFAGLAQIAGLSLGIAGAVRMSRYNSECRWSRDGLRLRGNLHLDSKVRRGGGAGVDLTWRF